MNNSLATGMICSALVMMVTTTHAQDQSAATATAKGSPTFCLYELPPDQDGKRRWINLAIVQYVEFNRKELKIYYGGGNLGSGHEARLPVHNPAQLDEILEKIRLMAANCR